MVLLLIAEMGANFLPGSDVSNMALVYSFIDMATSVAALHFSNKKFKEKEY